MGCYRGMLVGRVGGGILFYKKIKNNFDFNLLSIVNYPHRVVNVLYNVQLLKLYIKVFSLMSKVDFTTKWYKINVRHK